GRAKAFTSSESITLIVKGTCASELRTRFWPIRFTYSVTTGSCTSFTLASTCWAYSLPMRISPSREYQFPMPRPPILRLPIASTSFRPPSCLILASSFCGTAVGIDGWSLGVEVLFWSVWPLWLAGDLGSVWLRVWSCESTHGGAQNSTNAAIRINWRSFIETSFVCPWRDSYVDYTPEQGLPLVPQ